MIAPSLASSFEAQCARARLAGRRVVASVSGGRDSGAMSLYLTELGIEHERIFMDTGWEHPATYQYLRGPLTAKLGPITEIRGPLDFVQLVVKKGIFPSRNRKFCTEQLKVLPVQRWLNERVAAGHELVNAVGIRRAESRARAQMAEWEWSAGFDLEVWRPLVSWTTDDVATIHQRHDLAPNPLYGMGAKRGDNKHIPLTITETVEWARSGRGEWQPPGAGDGCMRWGVCETSADDEETP